jgi:error-prone DNA polymerase
MSEEPTFYELGARTNFSFLEGAAPVEEMIVFAKKVGLTGLGIADRNSVAGVVRAHAKAKVEGYPFQPGARLVFADGTPDILAYPRNRRGWGHLCRLLSAGNLRSKKGDCTLYLTDLLEWQEDLLLIVMPREERPNPETMGALLETLEAHVGNRLYLGLTPRYDGFDRHDFAALAAVARKAGVRLLATNDALYHDPHYRPLADVVTAIREHVTIASAGFLIQKNAERHLKGPKEMARLFSDHPEAIANARRFFKRLAFSLDELSHQYPDENAAGETPAETLRRLVAEGAIERYPDGVPEKVKRQLDYELELIHDKKYEPYFLTVHKLVKFARSVNILCQGRGSAANSSVCF